MRGGENATNGPPNCRSIISSDTWNISFFTYKPSNVSTYFIHGTARTRVTRIFRSGIQNRVRSNSALAETALGEESLYYIHRFILKNSVSFLFGNWSESSWFTFGTKNVLSAKKRKTAFQTLRLDSYLRHRRLNERESLNLSSGTVALKNFQLNHICMLCSSLFCFLTSE